MDNYLVLHVDLEFIAASICKVNGSHFPIEYGNEELLWLYFFNDIYHNRITFGKENKEHFHNLERNYYGDFLNQITDNDSKFIRNGIQRPVIELLENSGILNLFVEKYKDRTPFASIDKVPALITFSSTVTDVSRQMLTEYLSSKNFKIESNAIPIAELVTYYYWKENKFTANNEKVVLFLEATNTTLHLMKLKFIDGYFLKEEQSVEKYPGKGYDPRKKAIINFVVNEVNKSTGLLDSRQQIEKECERFESSADGWLKRVDAAGKNIPVNIKEIGLSPALSIRRNVLVRKDHIEEDTGYYISELINIYRTFEDKEVEEKTAIAAVILFGECFNNSLIKDKFTLLLRDKLVVTPVAHLSEILSVYPEIDFKKYSGEGHRKNILKKAEDDAKSKKAAKLNEDKAAREKELRKQDELRNKQIAADLFEKAKELKKDGKLVEAITKVEKAKSLNPAHTEIGLFYEQLTKEKKEIDVKTEKYNGYLKDAEKCHAKGEIKDALSKYKLAQKIFDSFKIKQSIENLYTELEELKSKKESENVNKKVQEYIEEATNLTNQNNLWEALKVLDKASKLSNNDQEILKKRTEVDTLIELQTTEYNMYKDEADSNFAEGNFESAEQSYTKALDIRPDDAHCLMQLEHISDENKKQEDKKNEYKDTIEIASLSIGKEDWDNAEKLYIKALALKPNDTHCLTQLEKILHIRKKLEDKKSAEQSKMAEKEKEYKKYIESASSFFIGEEWDDAEKLYRKALVIKPGDTLCLSQLHYISETRVKLEEERITEELRLVEIEKEYKKNIESAYEFFLIEEWDDAEGLYKKALKIRAEDELCLSQLKIITEARRKIAEKGKAEELMIAERKKAEELELAEKKRTDELKLEERKKTVELEPEVKKREEIEKTLPEKVKKENKIGRVKKKLFVSKILIRIGTYIILAVLILLICYWIFLRDSTQRSGSGSDTTHTEKRAENKITFPNGDFYVGEITDGQMNGEGNYTFKKSGIISVDDPMGTSAETGDYIIGKWENGKFLRGILFARDSTQKEVITLK
jgi:tetratricopeptide (TPR) repeat protein